MIRKPAGPNPSGRAMSFVPNGYLSIQEALNRLGRELFPLEWTGEEHKARRGLISEEEWLRIQYLAPARGGGAQDSGPMMQSTPGAKPGAHSSGDPSDPSYQEEYRARQRHVDAHCSRPVSSRRLYWIHLPGRCIKRTTSLAVARDQSDALRGSSSIPRRR